MAQQTPAFVISAANHGAELFRQAVSCSHGVKGGPLTGADYFVGQQLTPNMSVLVLEGRIWIPGSDTAPIGIGFTTQGMYFGFNDNPATLTIAAANPSNPRIDTVYVAVNDSFYGGSGDDVVLGVATGTPNASPTPAAPPADSYPLAHVAVGAGVTTIVTANITDLRQVVQPGSLSFYPRQQISGFVDPATTVAIGGSLTALSTVLTATWEGVIWVAGSALIHSGGTTNGTIVVKINGTAVLTVPWNDLGVASILVIPFDTWQFCEPGANTIEIDYTNSGGSTAAIAAHNLTYQIREMS